MTSAWQCLFEMALHGDCTDAENRKLFLRADRTVVSPLFFIWLFGKLVYVSSGSIVLMLLFFTPVL